MAVLLASIAALLFGFFGSMPLTGPIAVLVVSRAAQREYSAAFRTAAGASVAEAVYAGVALFGFSTFLAKHKSIVPISHGVTAVLLAILGVRFMLWRDKEQDKNEDKDGKDAKDTEKKDDDAGKTPFWVGLTTSALNPTLLATWSAVVAFLYSKGMKETHALVAIPFGASAGVGVALWNLVLVRLMRHYEDKFPRRAVAWVIRAMGAVLVGLGIWSGIGFAQYLRGEGDHGQASVAEPAKVLVALAWCRDPGEAPPT